MSSQGNLSIITKINGESWMISKIESGDKNNNNNKN